MSAAGRSLSEDHFLCSICLDVFTQPVSTPCGHNFCKTCITDHWAVSEICRCPNCKKAFESAPDLQVNTFISDMVAHFRLSSADQELHTGEVPCNVCTGSRLKALKSCLVCLESYCETHLQPHLTGSGLRRHLLMDPVKNLESWLCKKHDKPLELFCNSDMTCVCAVCGILDHKSHDVVSLKDEHEKRKAEVEETQVEIQERRRKVQELRQSVKVSRDGADKEIADNDYVFATLKDAMERNQAKNVEMIEEKHKATEKQAEGFIGELEQEIVELEKRGAELERIPRSEDPLHLVQNLKSLTAPPTRDWTEVSVCPPSYEGEVRKTAVTELVRLLIKEMKKMHTDVELKRVQQFAVDVTLDPDTANNQLILSDDGKQVYDGGVEQDLPYSHKRFNSVSVLGKQSFSSGRFYFEVQVKGKTSWVLGVCREWIDRKGLVIFSSEIGYWLLRCTGESYTALTRSYNGLTLESKPEKVGVFVDYDDGLVSFYDVGAKSVIYSFVNCVFHMKLLPFFSPFFHEDGKNTAPLVICPVHAE